MAVEVTTNPVFNAGVPKALFQFPGRSPTNYDVTADGQKLIKGIVPEAATPA